MALTKKQVALVEKHRDWNVVDEDWYKHIIRDFCDVAEAFGLPTKHTHVQFSGFASQGDGASWTSTWSFSLADILRDGLATMTGEENPYGKDPTKFTGVVKAFYDIYAEVFKAVGISLLNRDLMAVLSCYELEVTRDNNRYSHERTMNVDAQVTTSDDDDAVDDTPAEFHAAANALCSSMEEWLRGTSRALYESLEDEYDYLTSDEAVWESLEANGVEDEESEEDDQEQAA